LAQINRGTRRLGVVQLVFSILIVVVSLVLVKKVHGAADEEPVRYTVPPPKFPESDGDLVENTNIKVRTSASHPVLQTRSS
jgi:hypothetical protein